MDVIAPTSSPVTNSTPESARARNQPRRRRRRRSTPSGPAAEDRAGARFAGAGARASPSPPRASSRRPGACARARAASRRGAGCVASRLRRITSAGLAGAVRFESNRAASRPSRLARRLALCRRRLRSGSTSAAGSAGSPPRRARDLEPEPVELLEAPRAPYELAGQRVVQVGLVHHPLGRHRALVAHGRREVLHARGGERGEHVRERGVRQLGGQDALQKAGRGVVQRGVAQAVFVKSGTRGGQVGLAFQRKTRTRLGTRRSRGRINSATRRNVVGCSHGLSGVSASTRRSSFGCRPVSAARPRRRRGEHLEGPLVAVASFSLNRVGSHDEKVEEEARRRSRGERGVRRDEQGDQNDGAGKKRRITFPRGRGRALACENDARERRAGYARS